VKLHAEVVEAVLSRPDHQASVIALTSAYAMDPMGGGAPLPVEVVARLIAGLRAHPTTLIFLAFVGERAVGIATCFGGFSTFAAKPLLNIHDLAVLAECRGHGIGRLLLDRVARKATELGCCKLTLEVLENNVKARNLYAAAGFSQATYTEAAGGALFYAKAL
jgi:ribosomal protein S18 acetylase RimI-like enzyme